ncbi:dihydroorotase [Dethiothermospora halolimnae]|uniref:dihydroorotase n=1 Tax=Dethiothermospora halolimnae TaxID=3114390 RepID=UPI003CCC3B22
MELILKNGFIIDVNNKEIKGSDVLIKDGLIEEIDDNIEVDNIEVIDISGKYIAPGFVDIHVHFREPGYEYKETIKTGSMAAAKGGFTSVAVMPNTKPVIDSVDNLKILKSIIDKDSIIKVLPIGAVTEKEEGLMLTEIEEMFKEGIYAISDDGKPIMDKEIMEKAMKKARDLGIPILIHSEDENYVNDGCINEGMISEKLKLKGISREAENKMIERDIEIAKRLDKPIHICHISTKESVEMIRKAKKEGIKVTCEVTPHHFAITEKVVLEKGAIGKVNPPLRTDEDVKEIIQGIKDGTIDIIATDHAPHSMDEKQLSLDKAPFGLSGIELALPLAIRELVDKGIIDIFKLVELMSTKPREIIGIEGGHIAKGNTADLTVIDLDEEYILKEEDMVSKGKNTPFIGDKLKSKVKYTLVNGKIVYRG